jgi:hypothetical protein
MTHMMQATGVNNLLNEILNSSPALSRGTLHNLETLIAPRRSLQACILEHVAE